MIIDIWNEWNSSSGPKYPHEKVIQFCFRNYPLPVSEKDKNFEAIGEGPFYLF